MTDPFGFAVALLLAAIRPGAALIAAPVFGDVRVPPTLRIGIALAIAMTAPAIDARAPVATLSLVLGEVVTGAAIGFAAQAAFAAAMVAGEAVAGVAGLGFAMVQDAQGAAPVPSALLGFTATAVLLATNGHLALIAVVAASHHAMPPGAAWHLPDLLAFGRLLFGGAVAIALPSVAILLTVQIALALIARAAPALNLFAIGLPGVQLAGAVTLAAAYPAMADAVGEAVAATVLLAAR